MAVVTMTTYRILILILAIVVVRPGELRAGDPVGQKLLQGVEQLYNVKFDDAARSFDGAIAAAPDDPRGYVFRANVHLWSYLFDRRQEQLTRYMELSSRGISVAEARLSKNGSDATAKLFLGLSYGYRAIANLRAENFMATAVAARTCYNNLNEAVAADPKLYDAYLGLGIFHFAFGAIPRVGQLMAGLGGIKGDAQLGLREIETAAQRGTYFKNDAQLILALLNIYYRNNPEQGIATLGALAGRYPDNVAILYSLGSVYLDQGEPDKAVSYFDRVVQQGNTDFRTFTNLSYGRAGMAFFAKNDFSRSKAYLQKFLKNTEEKSLRAYAWFLLGECYEMEGNRDFAVKSYKRAVQAPSSGAPEDRYAVRKAKEWIASPMSPADVDLLHAFNCNAGGNREQAIAYSRSVLGRAGITMEQRAQANYTIGDALQAQKNYLEAIKAYGSAIHSSPHVESWIIPYAYFHIAESYLKLGNRDKWQENLDRARDFHGYDNEPQLRMKIERDVSR